MERHEILDAMSELKLYGMRASFDEIAGKGLTRQMLPQDFAGLAWSDGKLIAALADGSVLALSVK